MTSASRALAAAEGGPLELESIVRALSSRYGVARGTGQVVRRRRLDTFDRRLRSAGLTLEHEVVASAERVVLGRLDGSPTVTAPVKSLRWPALAGVLPAGPVRDTIAPVTGIRALMVASDEKRRLQPLDLQNEDGKTVARIELDEPVSAATAAQLTVHALRGYDGAARRAERLLVGLGLRPVEEGGERAGPARKGAGTDRSTPARVVLTGVLGDFLVTMRENLPGLVDDVDTEFLHDFRVAVRRTRSVLKLGRPALPDVMRNTWEPAFKRLGDLTTPVRDLDVYELDLPLMAGWLVTADPADLDPLARHLRSRRSSERRTLVRSLRSAWFGRLVSEWHEELARLENLPDPDRDQLSAGQLADRSIFRAHRRVARGGALITADSPAADLHELRKRCKELRYALEVFAPFVDHKAGKRAVADLKGLQDVLGRFQDSEVQRQALRGFAEEMMASATTAKEPAVGEMPAGATTSGATTVGAMLAMGELIGHLDAEQDRARREFDVAFARLERPSSLRFMHRLGGAT